MPIINKDELSAAPANDLEPQRPGAGKKIENLTVVNPLA